MNTFESKRLGHQEPEGLTAAARPASGSAGAGGTLGPPEALPELHEALLDEEALRSLLADVATYGTLRDVQVRRTPRGRLELAARLPEVYLALVERRIFGAQLRYEFEGALWLDTLLTTPSGVRLVRVELPG